MYRIMLARNGFYYVQKKSEGLAYQYTSEWSRCSGFFRWLSEARAFCRGLKATTRRSVPNRRNCVVEYIV